MKKELDIYNYPHRLEVSLRCLGKAKMSEHNKELILDFKDSLVRENLSLPRIIKYLNVIRTVAVWFGKNFEEVSKKDVERFVSYLHSKQEYSPYTKNGYKVMLKRFFRWFKQTDKEYPEEVKWISLRISASELNLPGKGDLLSEDEVKRLIDSAYHPRDKALISVLYESGCRIGELASLQIKNLEFDEIGLAISVKGKTGSRRIRLIASTQHLMTWLSMHSLKDDREAPLWINVGNFKRNQFLKYENIRKIVTGIFVKSGVKKRCNPHMFRHSRATFLAQHLTEFQMNQYFGWKQGSDMPSTYVHMSGRDLDKAILQLNGISTIGNKKDESVMQPVVCPRCTEVNSPGSKYCSRCAAMLDVQTIMEHDAKKRNDQKTYEKATQMMDVILADASLKRLLVDRLKEINELKS